MTALSYPWRRKNWHPAAGLIARIRASVLILLGHETEICALCGGKVEVVWWCESHDLWTRLTGWSDGQGIVCISCFDELAERDGVILQWTPRRLL